MFPFRLIKQVWVQNRRCEPTSYSFFLKSCISSSSFFNPAFNPIRRGTDPPTHRNSLAGSTRQKFPAATGTTATSAAAGGGGEGGSPVAGLLPTTSLTASLEEELMHDEIENEEEEEGMLLVEDVEMVREDEFLILGKEEGDDTGDVQLKRIGDDFSDLLDEHCFNPLWFVSGSNNIVVAGVSAS